MRRRQAGMALLLSAMLLAIAPAAASETAADVTLAALKAAYAEPGSRYMDVGGVHLHYVDEGAGPPLVLLNASYLNLSSWREVASRLKTRYRVIRLDFPTVGLTGPAPDAAIDIRAFEGLVLGAMDRLGIGKAGLVGTSSGAIVAFRLAAAHPERTERLVLLNAAGLPRTAATDPLRARVRAPDAPKPGSRAFWQQSLTANFADPGRLTEALVTQVHDLNRRQGHEERAGLFMRTFSTGDPQGVLAQVRAPTLILWGKKGVTLSHLEAEVFAHWLTAAPTLVRKYDDAGHYPQIERADEVATDIAAFMAGERDAQLVPPPLPTAASLALLPFWQANAGLWLGEDLYLRADGERMIDGYANLTDTQLHGTVMEEHEYRFYGPSEMANAMAGAALPEGAGVELRRSLRGHMADASGRMVITPETSGQGSDARVEIQPLAAHTGLMTVHPASGGPDGYRVHIDLTAPDQRIRTTLGLNKGAPGTGPQGSLRAIAIYREARQDPADKAALLAQLRLRFKVGVTLQTMPDGRLQRIDP